MEPQSTGAQPPLHVRVADSVRLQIERGELRPGDSLPTLHELSERWQCSLNPVRAAVTLLKQQGLITGGRGKAPVVRMPTRQVVRSSERHQQEKDLVLVAESARSKVGTSEVEMNTDVAAMEVRSDYQVVPASEDVARALDIAPGTNVLRRIWEHVNRASGAREAWSVSHIPQHLVQSNPALFDSSNEPWPGGTQHQLYTVGIEIETIIDEVRAQMPTTAEIERWELDEGVPMLFCRRISVSTDFVRVEISDAYYPADRTVLSFTTPLRQWTDTEKADV